MDRRTFLQTVPLAGVAVGSYRGQEAPTLLPKPLAFSPLAISMWDFSWLERRWPGAGYENWDLALAELTERGYNAVRIDAYPHLVANGPAKTWTLKPVWNTHDWGSPAITRVRVQPELNEFIGLCAKRGVKVGLSSWFREDADNMRMKISSPERMAEYWVATVRAIEQAGLLGSLLYVDLCNEWPGAHWAPYFKNNPPEWTWGNWHSDVSLAWMRAAVAAFRAAFPAIPVGFSFDFVDPERAAGPDLSFLDYAEPHIWMAQVNKGEFYQQVGYHYDLFKPDSYHNLALNGRTKYEANKAYWQASLAKKIAEVAKMGQAKNLPLMTTECWSVVDYKDWPLLDWDWILELCALGVREAVKHQQWLAIATSNFCGPQFRGMWRQVEWHQQMTSLIKNAPIEPALASTKLAKRLS
jgi:sugar phosphate isomerase/epimerase